MGHVFSKGKPNTQRRLMDSSSGPHIASARPCTITKSSTILQKDLDEHKLYKLGKLRLKNISKVEFAAPNCNRSHIKLYRRLNCLIKSSKTLHSLSLNMHEARNNDISNLFRSRKQLYSLRSLSLGSHDNRSVTDQVLKQIACGLKGMMMLRFIKLDLRSCSKITIEGVSNLCGGLKHFHNLHTFNLNLCDAKLENRNMKQLSLCLNNNPRLAFLSLDFSNCTKITDEGLAFLQLIRLISLRSLHLCFRRCTGLSPDAFQNGTLSLKHFILLNELKINLFGCSNLEYTSIKSISEELRHLPSLSSLYLNLDDYIKLSNQGIVALSKGLSDLRSLLELHLFVGSYNMTDTSLGTLSDALKCLSQLSRMTLHLTYCKNMTDTGIERLSDGIKHLKNLHHLSLLLDICHSITSEGVGALLTGLRDNSKLSVLEISLKDKNVTDDRLLESIARDVPTYLSLTCIDFRFVDCYKVSNKGLLGLSLGLRSCEKLSNLTLNFTGCINISKQGLEDLDLNLKYCSLLSTVCLEFKGAGGY